MSPETVPTESSVEVRASSWLSHRCPFVAEADYGSVEIVWRTRGRTIELHSLRRYLDSFEALEVSHEDLTEHVRDALAGLDGLEVVSVRTTWTTAGVGVTVARGPQCGG